MSDWAGETEEPLDYQVKGLLSIAFLNVFRFNQIPSLSETHVSNHDQYFQMKLENVIILITAV